jgi:putative IMPACT (imprinted ancient) family translation regulator
LVSGFVSDSLNGEKLVNASVVTSDYKNGVTSNNEGYFSLRLFFGAYGKKSVSTVQIDDEDMLKLDTNKNPEYYM